MEVKINKEIRNYTESMFFLFFFPAFSVFHVSLLLFALRFRFFLFFCTADVPFSWASMAFFTAS